MYRVNEMICTGCGDCVEVCPAGAITLVGGRAQIAEASCVECGSCANVCPQGAIVMADSLVGPTASVLAAQSSAAPSVAPAGEPASQVRRSPAEVLPSMSRRSRIWPMVSAALVWAARDLLPEVWAAWRASRVGDRQPISSELAIVRKAASRRYRVGHRHRWGRI